MTDTGKPILVFGASGRQGGSVARALLRANWPVRALVRDPEAPSLSALREAGVELIKGSYADTGAIRAAMRDAYGVYSVQPGASGASEVDDQELRAGIAIANLALEDRVAHLVYASGASVGEKLTGVARFDNKPRIEAHIRQLPIVATIVRPMIFMEMLVRPGFGLDKDRFTFFLKADQSMQLVAVEDIGKFVAAIFADQAQFGGKTLKIASDTVSGRELETIFSEAAGRPIQYSQFSDEVLATNPDLKHMTLSLQDGPLADHVDLDIMRNINPEIVSFKTWLNGSGRKAFEAALGGLEKPPSAGLQKES